MDDARKGMQNALKANPLDVRQHYEKQLRDLKKCLWRGDVGAPCPQKYLQAFLAAEVD